VFDWFTDPPPPGLWTRIGEASFDGENCAASEAASACWPVQDSWPSAWIWSPLPASDCVPFCVVDAVLPAFAADSAEFDWVTSPSLPGLWTRTGEAVLPPAPPSQPHGDRLPSKCCTAADSAAAACSVPLFWPSTWMPVPAQPHEAAAFDCEPVWFVVAALAAVADEPAVFDCVTLPPLPALFTRTGAASFDAPDCFAADAASAPCSVFASCFATWTPPAGPQAHGAELASCFATGTRPPVGPHTHGAEPAPCVPCCVVVAVLPAAALEPAVFDCVTLPAFPGLSTRTSTLLFDG
jgi:hypothetical protein